MSCGGIIDADYADCKETDGNIMIRIYNSTDKTIIIEKGKAICQGILHRYYIADDDNVFNERVGGFGSTGV